MSEFGQALPSFPDGRRRLRAKELAGRLERAESRNVTDLEDVPPFWTEALGSNVRDADDNVFLDFTGAFGVAFAGHRHPAVMAGLSEQMECLVHGMGDIHPPRVKLELLEALRGLAPWPDARGILGTSGSDAVESALKTAHLATGKPGILAFEGSYHGLALGALSATDRDHFRRPFTDRLTDHVDFAAFPVHASEVGSVLAAVESSLAGGAVGAVIVEPIQGRAGVRVPPRGFLPKLAALSRSHDALLIFDEIFTGLGRTGRRFAGEWEDVTPDLLCLGKALGGGLPMSACLAPPGVMDAWPPSTGEAVHTSTFLGHPLGCATALAFLRVLEDEDLARQAREKGRRIRQALGERLDGVVRDVRGRGLMIGVELMGPGAGARVAQAALEEGLIVLPAGEDGRVVELTPPATLSEAQIEVGVEVLVRAVLSAG